MMTVGLLGRTGKNDVEGGLRPISSGHIEQWLMLRWEILIHVVVPTSMPEWAIPENITIRLVRREDGLPFSN